MMIADVSPLSAQYALVDARYVSDGRWAALPGHGAKRLAPLLWTLSWGVDVRYADDALLEALSGLDRKTYRNASVALHRSTAVEFLPTRSPRTLAFRTAAGVRPPPPQPGRRRCRAIVVPGQLFAASVWSTLTGAECAVLMAVASIVQTLACFPGEDDTGQYPDGTFAWADENDLTEREELEDTPPIIRRIGNTTALELTQLSGVSRPTVYRATDRLVERGLLNHAAFEKGWVFQMPGAWWDVRRAPEARDCP